jgi:hypothetical protein
MKVSRVPVARQTGRVAQCEVNMSTVFLSYRRDTAAGEARALFKAL